MAAQLILFAGFTQIYIEAVKDPPKFGRIEIFLILSIACALGAYTSTLAWVNVKAAQKAISRLQMWWLDHYYITSSTDQRDKKWVKLVKYGDNDMRCPPINGIFTKNLYYIFDETRLPAVIAFAWLALFATSLWLFLVNAYNWDIAREWPRIAFALIALFPLYYLAQKWLRFERNESVTGLIRTPPFDRHSGRRKSSLITPLLKRLLSLLQNPKNNP
jgi:hypothetical protein